MLQCSTSRTEQLNVTIEKVDDNNFMKLTNSGIFMMNYIRRTDEGTYRCIVHNGAECPAASQTTTITVNYKPEATTLTSNVSTACLNNIALLTCTAVAKPATEYLFYKNGALLATSSTPTYTTTLSTPGSVEYTCTPTNTVGTGASATVTVTVKEPPVITSFSWPHMVVEGSYVVLQCKATGTEPLSVTIEKVGGNKLANFGNYTFSSIGRKDEGTYRCIVHNGAECPVARQITNISLKSKKTESQQTDVVPAVLEAVIAVLLVIIIALIIYFIWLRRSGRESYQSKINRQNDGSVRQDGHPQEVEVEDSVIMNVGAQTLDDEANVGERVYPQYEDINEFIEEDYETPVINMQYGVTDRVQYINTTHAPSNSLPATSPDDQHKEATRLQAGLQHPKSHLYEPIRPTDEGNQNLESLYGSLNPQTRVACNRGASCNRSAVVADNKTDASEYQSLELQQLRSEYSTLSSVATA